MPEIQAEFKGKNYRVQTSYKRNLGEVPKTYKRIGTADLGFQGYYNPSVAAVFQNRRGNYVVEIYRDGNFYPYYCKLVEVNDEQRNES